MTNELKQYKKYVEKWSIKTIIGDAVCSGIAYGYDGIDTKILEDKKRILINEINKRIRK